MKKKYLVLANGKIFEGKGFGYDGEAVGELVFNTAAVGYTENLTDPCYYGQIVAQTFPIIGNSGMNKEDFESEKPRLFGYVVREYCDEPSNFRSEMTVDEFLKEHKIPAICGVDTRELTEIIREEGAMNACIADELKSDTVAKLKDYKITDAMQSVKADKKVYDAKGEEKFNVVMIDYGACTSVTKQFTENGCKITALDYTATADEVLSLDPDGIILSQGPGNPMQNAECIETVKALAGKKPIFGIGLGHQIFALSQGATTEKMKFGHRGASQPVKCIKCSKVLITSQNHGYCVKADTLPEGAVITYQNVNDATLEGADYPALKAFTLQFPADKKLMADKFCKMMEEEKKCR